METSVQPQSVPTEPERRHELPWVLWVLIAAFGSYFCMYGFRKPFTAGSFHGTIVGGLGFKTILVTSQVAGYMLSKFIGIKFIAELPARRRAGMLIKLILFAEAALILFGLLPRPWNAMCLFLNGLPLGMTFGLVLGFLEGRRLTEFLTAGLCASFILADGVTKTVGAWLLQQGVSEDWMPSVAGLLYLPPLCVCVGMLSRITPPSTQDISARSERCTMDHQARQDFLGRYFWGLIPLVLVYLMVTIIRSIRADFAPEIWRDLGENVAPSVFTLTEMWVAFGVLALNGCTFLIRDNRHAFFASLAICLAGIVLMALALLAMINRIDGFTFMVLLGFGLYLPYVAIHTTVFERLLSMTKERGNTGFLMYVADATGYLGYVAVVIVRNFIPLTMDTLALLMIVGWASVLICGICMLLSWRYFTSMNLTNPAPNLEPVPILATTETAS